MLDVEVDVGRAVALGREEPLEQQPERDRVGLGDAERVADRAVRRAPPALAVDVAAPAELDDVDEQEEVAGEAELLDHVELVRDLAHRLLVLRVGRRVADRGAAPRRARAATSSRCDPSGTVVVGQARARRARRSNAHAARDLDACARPRRASARTGAPARPATAQVRERRRRQPAVDLVERAAGADGGERGGERPLRGRGVVHVVGGDHVDADAAPRPAASASLRCRSSGSPWSHSSTSTRSRPNASTSRSSARRAAAGPSSSSARGHRALAAAGEHEPRVVGALAAVAVEVHRCAGGARRARRAIDAGRALLPRELRRADRPGEAGVPDRALARARRGAHRAGRRCPFGGRAGRVRASARRRRRWGARPARAATAKRTTP